MRIWQNQPHGTADQELMLTPREGAIEAQMPESRDQVSALDRAKLVAHAGRSSDFADR